jgi:multicomponent Na+:H+ antiporter subunit B
MTPRQRLWLFALGAAGLAACYLWAFAGLPGFGNYPGPYGPAILRQVIGQTNATGAVSAINFEYRGFDTVGEEFILFTAAAGMSVVLRRLRGEREGDSSLAQDTASRQLPATSSPVRIVSLLLVGPTAVIGWWLATHAQANPSGGFQGGVIVATAFFLVYLSGEFIAFRRLRPVVLLDTAEAVGAGGFAAVGVTALALSLPYLYNYLPLGTIPGAVSSSGTIALISFLVGIEVAAAFTAIIGELLDQTQLSPGGATPRTPRCAPDGKDRPSYRARGRKEASG